MNEHLKKDDIYNKKKANIEPFRFNHEVSQVFEDMISRSVPGYLTTLEMINAIGRSFINEGSNVYDLGSSLGALAFRLSADENIPGCNIYAIDNAPSMIEASKKQLFDRRKKGQIIHPIHFICEDIKDLELKSSSLILFNFVLQFLPPSERDAILKRCFNALTSGGALLVSEKVTYSSMSKNEKMQKLHHEFKRIKGYTDLEISQKRTALENVLISDDIDILTSRLHQAGFKEVHLWMQCFNFISLIALK